MMRRMIWDVKGRHRVIRRIRSGSQSQKEEQCRGWCRHIEDEGGDLESG